MTASPPPADALREALKEAEEALTVLVCNEVEWSRDEEGGEHPYFVYDRINPEAWMKARSAWESAYALLRATEGKQQP